ncbi:MAG: hypothetical protein IKS85_07070 [Lachnospiraceae bacterium]|nr:hypothetical protein [Lachnospiraceae bacterium]
MDDKRIEKAMKLYEAMDGVDPELLARSEKAGKKNKVIPFNRYAKAMAACIALIVVGTACFAVLRNGGAQSANYATNVASDGTSNSRNSRSDSAAECQATVELEGIIDNNNKSADTMQEQAMEAVEEAEYSDNCVEPNESYSATTQTEPLCEGDQPANEEELSENLRYKLNAHGNGILEFQGKWMEVSINQGEPVKVKLEALARMLYTYVESLDVVITDDQEFSDYVTVLIHGDEEKAYCISGTFLKQMGVEETYEILDDDYDYDEFVRMITMIVNGED